MRKTEKTISMQHPAARRVFTFTIKCIHMKKMILAAFALLGVMSAFSQSTDEKNAQKRNVTGFQGIEISNGIDLYLTDGPESVSIYSSNNSIRDKIKTEVKGGILKIYLDNEDRRVPDNTHMKAFVSVNGLKSLSASGGCDVYLQNELKADHLDVRLSGGSDLKGKLTANELVMTQSGGSDVDISGTVKNLELNASGGSDLKGFDLVSDFASLIASGGSDCRLTVNREIRVMASGGSDVHYKGSASAKSISTSGSSSVNGEE